MPPTLPPIPRESWDKHLEDRHQQQTTTQDQEIASLGSLERDDQQRQQAQEQAWQQRTQQEDAAIAAHGQAEQQAAAQPEQDWQQRVAREDAQLAAFAHEEQQGAGAAPASAGPAGVGSPAVTASPPSRTHSPGVEANRAAVQAAFGDLGADTVENMLAIQDRESGGRNAAAKVDAIEDSHGAFQINARAHPQLAAKYDLTDPVQNAKAAREVYDSQGYRAWYNASTQLGLLGGASQDARGGPSIAPSADFSPAGPPPTPGQESRDVRAAGGPRRTEALGQFEQGLPYEEAASICGPVAALAFVQANGRNPSLAEVRALATKRGWTSAGGMNGVANEQALLSDLGVKSRLDTDPDFGEIAADASSGNPVIISTPVHYWFVNGFDEKTGKLFVGKTGTSRKGGGSWMSPQEIAGLDGGINGVLYVDNPQSPTPSVAADTGEERPPSEFEPPSQFGPGAGRSVGGSYGGESVGGSYAEDPAGDVMPPRSDIAAMRRRLAEGGPMFTDEEISRGVERVEPLAMAMTGEPIVNAGAKVAERAAMPAVDTLMRQWDRPAERVGASVAQKLEAARTFFVRKLTDRRVDLNQLQQEVTRLVGDLPEDMQLSELSRMNPSGAATLRVQNDLAPVIRGAGDDLPYVNALLAARGNTDVAAAVGRRAEQAASVAPRRPPEVEQFLAARDRVAQLEGDLRTAKDNGVLTRQQALDDINIDTRDAGNNVADLTAALRQAKADAKRLSGRAAGAIQSDMQRVEGGALAARTAGVQVAAERRFSGGVDAAQSAQAIDQMRAALGAERFANVDAQATRIAQVNKDLRQVLVDSGRITQETADQWARDYPNYTPTQVVDYLTQESGLPLSGQGKTLSVRGPSLQRLSEAGTERARLSPVASTINNVFAVETLAKQQATFTALHNWVTRVPELADRFVVETGAYTGTAVERAVTGFVNGEKVSIVTPFPEMARVLRQEPTQTIPIIGPVMQVFKELITARNPAFLVGNTLMDFPAYLVRETARAGGMPADAARAIGRYTAAIPDAFAGLMRGEFTGEATQRYLRQGGSMESWAQRVRSPQDAERYAQELRRSGGLHVSSQADLMALSRAVLTGGTVKAIGERIELVPRVAAFGAGEEAGLSAARSVVRGRDVTVDFAEGGTWAKTLNQAIPFLNPALQGGAGLVRTVYENPRGAGMTFALGLAAPTLAIEAWNNADEERAKAYADVPDYVKDRGWVVMLPGPGGVGVVSPKDEQGNPRPQYLGINLRQYAPVVAATRAAGRTAFGTETRSWGDLLAGAAQQVAPTADFGSATPLGVRTGAELWMNKDFYRGSTIATQNADERASILSRAFADGFNEVAARVGKYPNVRPSQVEFAARENLGVLAQLSTGASEAITGRKAASEQPQDVPVLGGFLRRMVGNATGQQLENAREARLDPEVQRALRDTGLLADVTTVPRDIRTVPLLQGEQTDYQRRANQRVNDALRPLLADPGFASLPPDVKKRVVGNVVQGAKAIAAGETLAAIGPGETGRRSAAELAKRRGG